MLAIRGGSWVFWVAVAVNVTQAFGVVAIPGEFWDAANNEYGLIGFLPSLVTDGGALILSVLLVGSFVVYRTTWARRKPAQPGPAAGE
jgi:hypothetical protein